jgi:hypothetical protein
MTQHMWNHPEECFEGESCSLRQYFSSAAPLMHVRGSYISHSARKHEFLRQVYPPLGPSSSVAPNLFVSLSPPEFALLFPQARLCMIRLGRLQLLKNLARLHPRVSIATDLATLSSVRLTFEKQTGPSLIPQITTMELRPPKDIQIVTDDSLLRTRIAQFGGLHPKRLLV